MTTTTNNLMTPESRFDLVIRSLAAIPAFGDSIGDNVSKFQLAIALKAAQRLQEQHQKMRLDLSDAYERLARDLPYNHALLVNIRSSLGIKHW